MDCSTINNTIHDQIFENWFCKKIDRKAETYLIVTSSLYPNDDCIEILIEKKENKYLVTDNGALFQFLFSFGIDLTEYNHKDTLNKVRTIAENYSFDFINEEFISHCEKSKLGFKVNLLIEAIKEASQFVLNIRESSSDHFKDEVIAFFKSKRTRFYEDYPISGYKKEHIFDVRLNGNDEVLAKTLSEKSSYKVQISIERAWYSFNDVITEGRKFKPIIIFNDTDNEHTDAWNEEHFEQLEAEGISALGLKSDKNDLSTLAKDHSLK